MTSSSEKDQVVINGTTLWTRDSAYGRLAFARQLEPSKWMYPDDPEKSSLTTPILIGYDGESGRDLLGILRENEILKEKVTNLESKVHEAEENGNYWRWSGLDDRVSRLERPWYRRLFSR